MIDDVPVVTAPDEIDVTTADQLGAVLLEASIQRHATIVGDMTRTHFCDSAALSVLVRAHKRALAEGGEVRLVIPADGIVDRAFNLTNLHHVIPRFDSVQDALGRKSEAVILPWRPRPAAGPGSGAP